MVFEATGNTVVVQTVIIVIAPMDECFHCIMTSVLGHDVTLAAHTLHLFCLSLSSTWEADLVLGLLKPNWRVCLFSEPAADTHLIGGLRSVMAQASACAGSARTQSGDPGSWRIPSSIAPNAPLPQ